MNYNTRTRLLQAAAGTAAAVALFAAWPGAARSAMARTQEPARVVGALIIPGREFPGAGREDAQRLDNERRLAEKLARWEARRAAADPEEEPAPVYTERELELLACVIYCEAGSDTISDETRRMVGEVVLNRVAHPDYPDSIEAVLTQRGQYGRFHWTGVVWPARASRSAEAHAVERAYECAEAVFAEERLLPEDVIYQAGFRQGRECVASAPGFYFCR